MGLTPKYCSCDKRFEVDGANAARDFLKSHGIDKNDIKMVWTAIALHTTPNIPEFMDPVIALVTAGVEMDVLGKIIRAMIKRHETKLLVSIPVPKTLKKILFKHSMLA